jgi:hypothetical protein|tara:strand:- start:636 stop:1118 length:483 start_codon:yes stop_codon:yes gene_type:complete
MAKKFVCIICKRSLSNSEFNSGTNNSVKYQRSTCKRCQANQRNLLKSGSPHAYLSQIFHKLKSNRIKQGMEWEIDLEHLDELWEAQKGCCALSGVFMTWQAGEGKQELNVSIDRKDGNKDYIIGNIQLVTQRVNTMKHTLGDSELYWWCKNIVKTKEDAD